MKYKSFKQGLFKAITEERDGVEVTYWSRDDGVYTSLDHLEHIHDYQKTDLRTALLTGIFLGALLVFLYTVLVWRI